MPRKGKKGTPPGLDHLFRREIIAREEYGDFWSRYWKAETKTEQKKVVAEFAGFAVATKSRKEAEADAKRLTEEVGSKYIVKRRDSHGRFSKRGRTFQAIRVTSRKE